MTTTTKKEEEKKKKKNKKPMTFNADDDLKTAWEGYNSVLDIIAKGLKQGIDQAVEDHKDPYGVWRESKDAYDYVDKLSNKERSRRR